MEWTIDIRYNEFDYWTKLVILVLILWTNEKFAIKIELILFLQFVICWIDINKSCL